MQFALIFRKGKCRKSGERWAYILRAQSRTVGRLFSRTGAKKPKIKVVSDRAIKQLNDLIRLSKLGYKCVVLFIVNRGDCEAFRPCHEADMLLAQMLLKAKQNEVMVLAHSVEWGLDGVGRWGRPLEVVFDESVRAEDIDYEHLERVLEFNSDPKNARRPPKKSKQKENDIMEQ
eukprot:TRINITY_DN60488_c0_g1_i1.p2 TRINITY_DN60488_c0_g1~~TRINITY_DN60488_c0_g1_i1.p2  ORF type:complete len:191 (-),score=19.43 TRINITY_DN60488_c0_g1_i1:314-835(-)